MPYQLTEQDVCKLLETATEQDYEEFFLLYERGKRSQERLTRATKAIVEKVGTVEDQCLPIALAYFSPGLLPDDIDRLKKDPELFRTSLDRIESDLDLIPAFPQTPEEVFLATRHPQFVAGLIYEIVSKPEKLAHLGLLLPGIGDVVSQKPADLDDLLGNVVYTPGDCGFPMFVSPNIPIERSAKSDEGDPIIVAYFDPLS